uniref:Ovule protein n=1 Tax=Strongyloides papillosus TaxID=174720 RepID=A0A0N5C9I9_STREA
MVSLRQHEPKEAVGTIQQKKIGSIKLSYPTLRQRSDSYSKNFQNRSPGVQLGGSLASSVFTRPCPNGLSPIPFMCKPYEELNI